MLFNIHLLLHGIVLCEVKEYTFTIQDWVVDYMRPTPQTPNQFSLPFLKNSNRKSPFEMKEEVRKHALLINGQYPGPEINVYENDTVIVHVINKMSSETTTIHWHGLHQIGTPWMDGSNGVAQAAIMPGQSFTYEFLAYPAGSHWYHSHVDAVQSAQGIKGAFVIKKRNDPFKELYSEELTINVSDEWREPAVCLKLEGAIPVNDVCADVRIVSWNGIYGDGSAEYPYPLILVEQGKCYRMRFIFIGVNTENLIISIAGHRMLLLAKDGSDVKPINITSFNMHLGERYDVVVCADQEPGNYLISAKYDYACSLTPGHFIPPGFSSVPACEFFSFLNYKGHKEAPKNQQGSPITKPPLGTGGGANPKTQPGVVFDLTRREGYSRTGPLNPVPEAEEPDVRYVINIGLKGPAYSSPTDEPMTKGQYYLDVDTYLPGRPWSAPSSPLYHTRGRCGADGRPIVDVPETAKTVELVINNLSPAAHILHMHGHNFRVINFADFQWCNLNRTDCFLRPSWLQTGGCDREDVQVGDPKNPNIVGGLYWGCKFNSGKNRGMQNLKNPLEMDTLQVWQRSWAVIRFTATNPGWWFFHCHMEQHIPLGMQMMFNILPSKQKKAPMNVPTVGTCPMPGLENDVKALVEENESLRKKLANLQPQD